MSEDALVSRQQVLKVSFDCLKASNFRSEKPMGDLFDAPPGRSRVNPQTSKGVKWTPIGFKSSCHSNNS